MQEFLQYGIGFSLAAIIVLCSVPWVKAIASRFNWFDKPGNRKVHRRPMVRLGGISIYLGTVLTLGCLVPFHQTLGLSTDLVVILLGASGFFLLGLLDDLFSLPALWRLLFQFGIAGFVWQSGIRIDFVSWPAQGVINVAWLSLPITLLWIVGIVNAINWMDGLDGLASGVSGIAIVVIFLICFFTDQSAVAFMAAVLAGSILSFLYYNFNPASIFMGDGGSYFIGFMIATFSIVGLVKSAVATTLLIPLVILAIPLLDMSSVILTRLAKGSSPFKADRSHLHHRLLRMGFSHRGTVLFIYILSLWVGSLAMTVAKIPNGVLLLILSTTILMVATWRAWQIAQ